MGGDQFWFIVDNLGNLLWGLPKNRPGGLVMSLLLSAAGLAGGLLPAIGLGLARRSPRRSVRACSALITRTVRGVPLVLLLLLVQRAVAVGTGIGGPESSLLAALISLILYSAAYQADIVEAGLRAVPTTLLDDATLLGAGPWRRNVTVGIPYAARIMRPALAGQAITLFKDSSVVVILGVADLTTTARLVLGGDVGNTPFWVAVYLTVGAIYFVVAFGLSRLAERWGRTGATTGLLVNYG